MAEGTTISPDQFATNWANGMKNNVGKMRDSIGRVTESPMEKAAEKAVVAAQRALEAAQSGKTANALRKVTLADWKQKTQAKITERLAGGVDAAKSKMTQFGQWLIPTVNAGMQQVNAMPNTTFQERLQKMTAWATYMHENSYKG